MGDMRRLSNIKWIATGVDGHTHHTCGEWMYTSDAPPVEAEEYKRMKQRAEGAEVQLAELAKSHWSEIQYVLRGAGIAKVEFTGDAWCRVTTDHGKVYGGANLTEAMLASGKAKL